MVACRGVFSVCVIVSCVCVHWVCGVCGVCGVGRCVCVCVCARARVCVCVCVDLHARDIVRIRTRNVYAHACAHVDKIRVRSKWLLNFTFSIADVAPLTIHTDRQVGRSKTADRVPHCRHCSYVSGRLRLGVLSCPVGLSAICYPHNRVRVLMCVTLSYSTAYYSMTGRQLNLTFGRCHHHTTTKFISVRYPQLCAWQLSLSSAPPLTH